MRLFLQHHPAYTLIELLVTVAIVGIVIGGGVAGFVSFTERQRVLNTAKEVQQLMRTAQSKARVREVPELVVTEPCLELKSYHVGYNSQYFTMKAHCKTTGSPPTGALGDNMTRVAVSTDVTVTAPIWVRFNTLEGGVTFEATATAPYEYKFEKGTNKYKFTVSPTGNISNVEKY